MGIQLINPAGDASQIKSATKPTTRIDGSALVIGDVWVAPNNQRQWFWNGTYWISAPIFTVVGRLDNSTSFLPMNIVTDMGDFNILIQKVFWNGKTGSANSGSAYRKIDFFRYDNNGANTNLLIDFATTAALTASTYFSRIITLNYLITTPTPFTNGGTPAMGSYFIQSNAVGSPGAIYESYQTQYCLVAK